MNENDENCYISAIEGLVNHETALICEIRCFSIGFKHFLKNNFWKTKFDVEISKFSVFVFFGPLDHNYMLFVPTEGLKTVKK